MQNVHAVNVPNSFKNLLDIGLNLENLYFRSCTTTWKLFVCKGECTSFSETELCSNKWSRSPWEQHLQPMLNVFKYGQIDLISSVLSYKNGQIHFWDQDQRAPSAEEIQQTGDPGMSQAGEQVPLLKGSGASAAPQRQKLGSKDFTCPSVNDTLHHPKCSPSKHKVS